MAYSDKLINHYENPQNVGSLDKSDPDVGTGLVGAPACGDVMKLQLKINEHGIIEEEAMSFSNQEVVEALGGLPPVKIHCSVLAEDAIKAAIADYQKKKGVVPVAEPVADADSSAQAR